MQRICLVLLAAAVVSTAQEQSRVQGEARLGANLSKVVLRRATKIENAEVQGYVEGLVRRLAQQFRKYEFPFTVAILEDDDRMLEPQTLPGGYLFLKASHILEVRSEAGLARILAHAMAHIAERHSTQLGARMLVKKPMIPLVFIAPLDGPLVPASLRPAALKFHQEADTIAEQVVSAAGYDSSASGSADRLAKIQATLRASLP
jgi:predicted Zn-dependent protease